MNAFETDFKRACFSVRFLLSLTAELLILFTSGFDSDLFRLSVPVVCTFSYACGFLDEYKNGFVKFSLAKTSYIGYILGKFFACGIAGGLSETLPAIIYKTVKGENAGEMNELLLFLSAFLWASLASALAALSNSKYAAYGGSFVLYHFLIILHDRYWEDLYCLYPYEWLQPNHTWIFDETGVMVLLVMLIVWLSLCYYLILRRRLSRV